MHRHTAFFPIGLSLLAGVTFASPLTVTLLAPPRPESGYFSQGTTRDPAGHQLTLDSLSLRRDGQPWLPVMGEFHYTRYPAAEWREELLKMKAGGIDIVATYVFWIHHEEVEGTWNWSGQHDLRLFLQTAKDVGLDVVVRAGPWCHGEVRNGGLPEWVVTRKDWKVRSTDPKFLEAVRELYRQIATQARGLLWKDGGPVVALQIDNEFHGPAEYLLALKTIARDEGLDVPFYTRTGWPALTTPMPLGEIVPLYGVYAEGFWDRQLTSMPGKYRDGFQFSALRSDAAIATEMLGNRTAKDDSDVSKYPFLTCEIGGGMMNSYHRRILVDPRDVEATTLIKVAGGSTLPGYYMYHGGTNPDGRLTTLMEAQDTVMTNYNDLPVKTYDFQAPLGEFGEVRPQYHSLRRLHLFLHDFGSELCGMTVSLPDHRPAGRDDDAVLRWAARTDGRRGFVFVNNYERSRTLSPKSDIQFSMTLTDGRTVTFPTAPMTIPTDTIAWWPFNLKMGGVTLISATAQPFAQITEANGLCTVFFAATPGVPSEFVFSGEQIEHLDTTGRVESDAARYIVRNVPTGHGVAIRAATKSGAAVQCVLLDDGDSRAFWKGSFAGRTRAILSRSAVVFDRDGLRLTPQAAGAQRLAVFPAVIQLDAAGLRQPEADGIFQRYTLPEGLEVSSVAFKSVRNAGPLREIHSGPIKEAVAAAPKDADFAAAAVWRIALPKQTDFSRQPRLRFDYVGDVARVTLAGRLLTDDFYNGSARELGLWRYQADLAHKDLEFAVLPLQAKAPIFMAPSARPEFGGALSLANLRSVSLIQTTTLTVTAKPAAETSVLPANFRTELEPKR